MTERRKLFAIMIVASVLNIIAGIAVMTFVTDRYERTVHDANAHQIGAMLDRYVADTVWDSYSDTVALFASENAQQPDFRNLILNGQPEELNSFLPQILRSNSVTSGEVNVQGLTVYRSDGSILTSYNVEGDLAVPAELSGRLSEREGSDRLQRLVHYWSGDGAPQMSLIVPVGGLRLVGYLAVHTDPLHALSMADQRMGMDVIFHSATDGRVLTDLENYFLPEDVISSGAMLPLHFPDGELAFEAAVTWDVSETSKAMASMRFLSLSVLAGVIAIIGLVTIGLVFQLMRRIAHQEALAAEDALKASVEEENERREAEDEMRHEANEDRRRTMIEMADALDESVNGVVEALSTAATQIEGNAGELVDLSAMTTSRGQEVGQASLKASSDVQTVASASEELSASINEIGSQVTQASSVASDGVNHANLVGEKARAFDEATSRIGNVVDLIKSVAEQTNLLALNATIEAARAGEAGKGFAVVAAEVKTLASQTADATEEITTHIGTVQSASTEVVSAIDSITHIIGEISGISSEVSITVDEQRAATSEIAKSVSLAAGGAEGISSNISEVTDAAALTSNKASELRSASAELTGQAQTLRQEMKAFLEKLRAA